MSVTKIGNGYGGHHFKDVVKMQMRVSNFQRVAHTVMAITKHMKDFCAKTSLKGLPKAVTNDSKMMKGLWAVAMMSFVGTCFYQVGMISCVIYTLNLCVLYRECNVESRECIYTLS